MLKNLGFFFGFFLSYLARADNCPDLASLPISQYGKPTLPQGWAVNAEVGFSNDLQFKMASWESKVVYCTYFSLTGGVLSIYTTVPVSRSRVRSKPNWKKQRLEQRVFYICGPLSGNTSVAECGF